MQIYHFFLFNSNTHQHFLHILTGCYTIVTIWRLVQGVILNIFLVVGNYGIVFTDYLY